jgi:hypothetical protein
VESVLLFLVTKWRLGLHVFIWRPRTRSGEAGSPQDRAPDKTG